MTRDRSRGSHVDNLHRSKYHGCLKQDGAMRIILSHSCFSLAMTLEINGTSGHAYSRSLSCGNRKVFKMDGSVWNRTKDISCSTEMQTNQWQKFTPKDSRAVLKSLNHYTPASQKIKVSYSLPPKAAVSGSLQCYCLYYSLDVDPGLQ